MARTGHITALASRTAIKVNDHFAMVIDRVNADGPLGVRTP